MKNYSRTAENAMLFLIATELLHSLSDYLRAPGGELSNPLATLNRTVEDCNKIVQLFDQMEVEDDNDNNNDQDGSPDVPEEQVGC